MVHRIELKNVFPFPVLSYFFGAVLASIIAIPVYWVIGSFAGYALIVGAFDYLQNKEE